MHYETVIILITQVLVQISTRVSSMPCGADVSPGDERKSLASFAQFAPQAYPFSIVPDPNWKRYTKNNG